MMTTLSKPRPDDNRDTHREEQVRKGHGRLGHAIDRCVDPSAEISREQTERDTKSRARAVAPVATSNEIRAP